MPTKEVVQPAHPPRCSPSSPTYPPNYLPGSPHSVLQILLHEAAQWCCPLQLSSAHKCGAGFPACRARLHLTQICGVGMMSTTVFTPVHQLMNLCMCIAGMHTLKLCASLASCAHCELRNMTASMLTRCSWYVGHFWLAKFKSRGLEVC